VIQDSWAPDRRRTDRRVVPYRSEVNVAGLAAPLRLRELGSGGMVIESASPLGLGDGLVFTLAATANGGVIGPMHGHVAHSRLLLAKRFGDVPACLAGVAFDHLTPEQSAQIATVLADIDERRRRRQQDAP
jgi:hypothetical protein